MISFRRISPLLFCVAILLMATTAIGQPQSRLNVLLVLADDQNTRLGCYGDRYAKTPNLDKLASEGIIFTNAYCQQPLCGPSRASILTGLRPDQTKVFDLRTPVRKPNPTILTLPQDFKNRGYYTRAIGKIFHPGVDDPDSWSVETFNGPEVVGTTSQTSGTFGGLVAVENTRGKRGPSWFAPDLPEDKFHDGVVTDEAIKALEQLKKKPFFLAVGYNRPHLPFVAPRKYFDKFPDTEIPAPVEADGVPGASTFGVSTFAELRQYRDIPATGPLSLQKSRELTRAYYACASFMDAQVGRLLTELERLQLDRNTIVVFLGDHGFHLGENGVWAKNVNWEAATRAPLLLRVPGGRTSGSVERIVEFVDIYPTLAELCGWQPDHVSGESLAGYFSSRQKPDGESLPVADVALSQVHRGGAVGYSLRSPEYRYTEWRDKKSMRILDREFYRYDGGRMEKRNEADEQRNAKYIEQLHHQIDQLNNN